LQQLSNAELTSLPLPGHGRTLTRWRALSEVAAHDLSLAQLFEAHADAIAIHDELARYALPLRGIWGVWTTEAGRAGVVIDGATDRPGDESPSADARQGAGAQVSLRTRWSPRGTAKAGRV
jgi:hypothetical protein